MLLASVFRRESQNSIVHNPGVNLIDLSKMNSLFQPKAGEALQKIKEEVSIIDANIPATDSNEAGPTASVFQEASVTSESTKTNSDGLVEVIANVKVVAINSIEPAEIADDVYHHYHLTSSPTAL